MNNIDQLGYLRAQIADLQAQAKELEKDIKDLGAGAYDGDVFHASVSVSERASVDWKTIAQKLEPSRQLVTAHTTYTETTTLRVTARKKVAA